ncbi:MAG: toprim domain-containing protein [Chitinophagales bacterium]|nr:toprim domain-containing protein [Chitinophagales bacterium]
MLIKNLEQIRDVPILDVIEALGLSVNRQGKIPSPFKDEHTPSCHVYLRSNSFYCFASAEGGDGIKLWQLLRKCDFLTAVEAVAKIGAVHIEKGDTGQQQLVQDNSVFYAILEAAAAHYAEALAANKDAMEYLSKRGYRTDTITTFQIGYASGTVGTHLMSLGFKKDQIEKVLLNKDSNDTFYKRIVFPITDHLGRIVGFTGRSTNEQQPKYINSPETIVYSKQKHLYGLHQAKKGKGKSVYLVEGCTDVLALHQVGLCAVATLGTALSDTHIKQLKGFESVVIWRDNDEAGKKAMLRDITKMIPHECYPKVVNIKDGSDPDEYIRKNGANLNIEHTDGILVFATEKLHGKENKPIEKDEAINEIAELLYDIPSGSLREVFATDICKIFKIDKKVFFGKLREQKPKDNAQHSRSIIDARHYMRIGTKFFKKIVTKNPRYNTVQVEYVKWEQTIIKEDYKMFPSFSDHIQKYDGFTVLPNYQQYQESVEVKDPNYGIFSRLYNLTKPLPFLPKQGDFPTIKKFLIHIFGDEHSNWDNDTLGNSLTLIKDCYRIKLQKPTEMLPVVCLVGKEQESGKSTILKFNKDLFGDNAVIIGNEHLRDKFNTTYADKQIVGIDENFVTIEEKSIKEKIKKMATDDEILYHPKGIDPSPLPWFGWLVLCSNDENDFMPLETSDRRFWVTKVKTPKERDPDLRKKMMLELPAFLYWAMSTNIFHPKETRMWFATKYIVTDQMMKIASRTRPYLETMIVDYVKSIFLTYPNVYQFSVSLKEFTRLLNETAKYELLSNRVADWLEDNKNMVPGKQTQHCKWVIGWNNEQGEATTTNINWVKKLGKPLTFMYQDWITESDFDTEDETQKHKDIIRALEIPF